MDLLSGGSAIRQGLDAGVAIEDLTAGWEEIARRFESARQTYLLYE
jgi:uncharacterized protein YbbC (DUF1343 family)